MLKFISTFNNATIEDKLFESRDGLLSLDNVIYDNTVSCSPNDECVVFFLGEIYNKQELINQFSFDDLTEAQLISKLYLQNGISAFKLVDGCFSFFIKQNESTLIFRDRHGAGAQVYYNSGFFTNELLAFKKIKGFVPEPDMDSIITFLELGYIPSPASSLKGVCKLPAGHLLVNQNGNITVTDLFGYEEFSSENKSMAENEAIAEYEKLHKQSIHRRIAGKKNIALLLSGGYDSGGNISALREIHSGKITGFSVGFKDNPWTEVPLAELMAEKYDADFHSYIINGSEIEHLPEIVQHLGDPFQEAGLMVNFCAMRMVGEYTPDIVLGGDGNDQHFGTFGKEAALNYMLKGYGLRSLQKIFSAVSKNNFFENDNPLFRARFHNEKILNVLRSDSFGFKNHQFEKLLSGKYQMKEHAYAVNIPSSFNTYNEMYAARNYFVDIKQVVNEVILFKASKMAEMFGNNIAFPYMDKDIYNFLKGMPRDYKLKGSLSDIAKGKGVAKFLHKAYLKPKLPAEITQRKKQGGFAPLSIFFSDIKKRNEIKSFILNSNVTKAIFNADYIRDVFEQYNQLEESGGYWFWYKQVKSAQLFNLLVISIWWEIMIEDNQRTRLSDYLI